MTLAPELVPLRRPPANMSSTLQLEDPAAVTALIDHTLLNPKANSADIDRLCEEAAQHHFATVCVNPFWVEQTARRLRSSSTKVCTTIGFPLGANVGKVKRLESEVALQDGARELDMVLNIGALRSGQFAYVQDEIAALADVAHSGGAILKVIIETCQLDDEQKIRACQLAADASADFVKTSTGFSSGGATVADVALMRRVVGQNMGVKASGGVRTLKALREMVLAGATRIGTSSGVQIVDELRNIHLAAPPDRHGAGTLGY